ncbi:hypothetical protein [Streptomyces sp. NPDC021020]|uniref:hypothetical protein n=1 Tax=Streptomyces sp. NPDC021020 TaxID=3365109 RepID=UPI0037A732DA
MEALVPGAAAPGGYEVRLRWGVLRVMQSLILPLVVAAYILYPYNTRVKPLSLVLGGLSLVLAAVVQRALYRMRKAGCLIRVDPSGITVHGEQTVPWRDLDRAVVVRGRVVAFHARQPDRQLPLAPVGAGRPRSARIRRQLDRRFGTQLVVSPRLYGRRVEDLVAAVRRYSPGLPVFDGD